MSFSGSIPGKIEGIIANSDSYFPDLDIGIFQKVYRLPAEYSSELLEAELITAMLEVNQDLASARTTWQAAGESALTKIKQALYFKAVYNRAKAILLQQFATVASRPAANNTGKEAPERYRAFLKLSENAIRQLQGRGRIGAAAI